MKYIITLFTCIFFPIFLLGQNISDTTFYDVKWQKSTKGKHSYFRITKRLENGKYECTDYWNTGEIQMIGYYSSLDPDTMDGEFVWYYKTGKIKETFPFKNNKPSGISKKFKPDGVLDFEYVDLDILDNAKEINATIPKFISFVHKNLNYPESSRKAEIEGQVMIAFYIDQDGLPFRIAVTKSVSKELDEEAIRVIKLFKWPVPIFKREKTMTLVILPATFILK